MSLLLRRQVVSGDATVTILAAALSLFAVGPPSVSASSTLTPTPAAHVMVAAQPSVSAGTSVSPAPAASHHAAAQPSPSASSAAFPAPGSVLLAGASPGLSAGSSVSPGPGASLLAAANPFAQAIQPDATVLLQASAVSLWASAAPIVTAGAGGGDAWWWKAHQVDLARALQEQDDEDVLAAIAAYFEE